MKLSVCIFTYNHAKYISRAIESVLAQKTNFEFEIVIGEDCSTDATADIAWEYQQMYPGKVRVFCNPINLGMMENIPKTILSCSGEYIAMLDGDDHWTYEYKLQKQVDLLDKNGSFSMCFHDGKIISSDGRMRKDTCCQHVKASVVTFKDVICRVNIPTFSVVFRRSSLRGFPPDWFKQVNSFDRPLYLLLLAGNSSAYYFPECWGIYRQDALGNWTRLNYERQCQILIEIYHAVNRHYNNKYNRAFVRSERFVLFDLALTLLKENKRKPAWHYFREFKRINSNIFSRELNYYYRFLRFNIASLRLKFLNRSI